MKTLLVLLLFFANAVPALYAASSDILINWGPPIGLYNVQKHTLYRVQAGVTNKIVEIPMPLLQTTLTNVGAGNYIFVLTASNGWGESPASPPVVTPVGFPPAPTNVSVTIQIKIP